MTQHAHRTLDKSSPEVTYFKTTQLGPKQSLTPEGFLLCEDVPLARAGEMLYGPDETPIAGVNGNPVVIHRDLEELFRPETIASFQGKPVVNEHPEGDDVNVKNYKELCCGTLLNVREGDGDNEDLLVGDLLITDSDTITDVRSGKREVSLGYDADYEELEPGVGRQLNIIGNHVALVERGRCGPRCAIGDHDSVHQRRKETPMPGAIKPRSDRRKLALTKVRDSLEQLGTDLENLEGDLGGEATASGGEATHVHIHMSDPSLPGTGPQGGGSKDELPPGGDPTNLDPNLDPNAPKTPGHDDATEARFQSLEKGHAELNSKLDQILQKMGGEQAPPTDPSAPKPPVMDEMPDEEAEELAQEAEPGTTKDAAAKFRDSAPLEATFRETMALAEILVPGFRFPTFDKAASPKSTKDTICSMRRKALDSAYSTTDGKLLIDTVNGGKPFDPVSASCSAVRSLFVAAAGAKKLATNHQTMDSGRGMPTLLNPHGASQSAAPVVSSVSDLNALFKNHYKGSGAVA